MSLSFTSEYGNSFLWLLKGWQLSLSKKFPSDSHKLLLHLGKLCMFKNTVLVVVVFLESLKTLTMFVLWFLTYPDLTFLDCYSFWSFLFGYLCFVDVYFSLLCALLLYFSWKILLLLNCSSKVLKDVWLFLTHCR